MDLMIKISPLRAVRQGSRLLRETVQPFLLDVFKTRLDKALYNSV